MDHQSDQLLLTDAAIVDLYFARSEEAIGQTLAKYGKLFLSVSKGILENEEDAAECLNDTLLKIWNSIPPNRPNSLGAYGSRIVRNLSLDALDKRSAEKRGGNELGKELDECLPESLYTESEEELSSLIDRFLRSLERDRRILFVRRYFFGESVRELSDHFGVSCGKVKSDLFRIRKNLKSFLQTEGVSL